MGGFWLLSRALPHMIMAEVNRMFIVSINYRKKILRVVAVIVLLAALLWALCRVAAVPTAAVSGAEISEDYTAEENDSEARHYPGEPARVYAPLDEYWSGQLSALE